MRILLNTLAGLACVAGTTLAADPVETARPIPLTRPAMKQLLEEMKGRKLRIPLPELTDEDKERLGERGGSYESRLRYHYMPEGEPSVFGFGGGQRGAGQGRGAGQNANAPAGAPAAAPRDFTRNGDEAMTLSYSFKTMLFWVVSRTNNCQYCLGHQEQKLSAAGLTEDEIAALDFDWSRFKPAEQAALAFARKVTYQPHAITDADLDALRAYYTDLQILEMTVSVAGNNAINRWKEGSGTPQSQDGGNFFRRAENLPADRPVPDKSFLTPTSSEFQTSLSKVATVQIDKATGQPTTVALRDRPKLESREQVEEKLAATRKRESRLPLVSEEAARQALGENAPAGPIPNWIRLMANFPNEARSRLRSIQTLEDSRGDLTPLLKAQVSWIIARQDRAWYATGLLQKRLRELGQTDDQIYALDGDWQSFTPAERSLFKFARNLASTPIGLTDDDVAESLALTGPRQVVQLINFVTSRAYFDRVTEVAGLPLE